VAVCGASSRLALRAASARAGGEVVAVQADVTDPPGIEVRRGGRPPVGPRRRPGQQRGL
jgi:hypothetical protein